MPKTTTVTSTKAATKKANASPTEKKAKVGKEDKPKRAPSAYNLFVQAHMKQWLAENEGKSNKDAMGAIGAMWREAEENPNRGKEPKARKPKAAKDGKENSKSKSKSKPKKAAAAAEVSSEAEEEVEAGSDE